MNGSDFEFVVLEASRHSAMANRDLRECKKPSNWLFKHLLFETKSIAKDKRVVPTLS